MGFLSYILNRENRSLEEEEVIKNKITTSNLIQDNNDYKHISTEGALGLSAVWACVRLLSETVGTLPIHLYEKTKQGREVIRNHQSFKVLQQPNTYLNRYDILYHLVISCTLWGNGYVRIVRDKYYRPISLKPIHPYKVEPILSDNEVLFYRINGSEMVIYSDIIHLKGLTLDGIKGKSPISVHRENLILSQSALRYGEKFFSQGGNTAGVFTYPATLTTDQYKRLKNDLIAQSIGLDKAHKPLLLEGGMKYERISIPPEDAQFIATRKFQKTEIATIYGIPPHMIADLDRSTNNNIEHQGIEFVNYCLMPYLVKLEGEFNRKLLTQEEFDKYYYKFNVNALQRGDAKTRAEFYKIMNMISSYTPNEIRELEDMNIYDGGDNYYYQLNMGVVGKEVNNQNKNKNNATE